MSGHYEGELWGLAIHPKKELIYSVGEDYMLALWDIT